MTDQWAWWREAVGNPKLARHEPAVQSGFYKILFSAAAPHVPVAIWRDEFDNLQCRVGYDDFFRMQDPAPLWTSCWPVKHGAYLVAAQTHQWPLDYDRGAVAIAQTAALLNSTDPDPGEMSELLDRMERLRKLEKAYYLDGCRRVDAKFNRCKEQLSDALKRAAQYEEVA